MTMNSNDNNVSTRRLRVGELIRHALSEAFNREQYFDAPSGVISVTVSEVRMSADLKLATAYVSPFGLKVDKTRFLAILKEVTPSLRIIISKKVRLKYSPELIFRLDESFNNANKIETILKSLE